MERGRGCVQHNELVISANPHDFTISCVFALRKSWGYPFQNKHHSHQVKQAMTAQEKINCLINNNKVVNTFVNLWGRWQDEKEYEDIRDYASVLIGSIQKNCPELGAILHSVTTRPFGIKVVMNDAYLWHIFVKADGNSLVFHVKPLVVK